MVLSLGLVIYTQTIRVIGGAMRDRTADLLAASEALSQLSYSPKLHLQEITRVSLKTGRILWS